MPSITIKSPSACLATFAALLLVGSTPALAGDGQAERHDCIIEPHRVLEVGTAAVGVLQEVRVDRSDRVDAGQVIALLESGVESATLDIAQLRASIDTEVHARRVTYELQRSNRERTDRLRATRAVAEKTREEAVHDARLSELRLRQAREEKQLAALELARARQALARRVIRSPVAGLVMERHKSPGERVEDQPILRIAQMHPLRVEVVLPAEHYGSISNGMRARVFSPNAPGGEFLARVTAIDPVLDAASSTFGVQLSLPNPDYAIPGGLRCTLAFLPAMQADAEVRPAPATPAVEGTPPEPDDAGVARTAEPPRPAATAPERATPPPVQAALETNDSESARQSQSPVLAGSPDVVATEAPQPETPPVTAVDAPASNPPTTPESTLAAAPIPAVRAVASDAVCFALGPIDDAATAKRLRRAFVRRDLAARVRKQRTPVLLGYMVAVDALETGYDTDALLAALRSNGIRDIAPLRRTPGRVSVGFFRGPVTARARAEQIQAIGLPARIHERRRAMERYMLEVTGNNDRPDPALLAKMLDRHGLDALTPSDCAGLVTASR